VIQHLPSLQDEGAAFFEAASAGGVALDMEGMDADDTGEPKHMPRHVVWLYLLSAVSCVSSLVWESLCLGSISRACGMNGGVVLDMEGMDADDTGGCMHQCVVWCVWLSVLCGGSLLSSLLCGGFEAASAGGVALDMEGMDADDTGVIFYLPILRLSVSARSMCSLEQGSQFSMLLCAVCCSVQRIGRTLVGSATLQLWLVKW
jgi:hypothetical protein